MQFYQATEFKFDLASKALFLPGPSTMDVHILSNQPEVEYPHSKITRLNFSSINFYKLLKTIDDSFDRQGKKRAPTTLIWVERGGRFYDACGSYNIFNTCNIWTAKVLRSGGLPISTSIYSATALSVMSQVEQHGIAISL